MKKFLIFVFTLLSLSSLSGTSFAKENDVNAYFFYGQGCPHCAKEEAFFETIKDDYPTLNIKKFEVYFSRENGALMKKVSEGLKANVSGVPFLVIGDKTFVGYAEGVTSVEIEDQLRVCLTTFCSDPVAQVIKDNESTKKEASIEKEKAVSENPVTEGKEKIIKLPFLGSVNVYKVSVPFLAVTMGLLDGFNPCAMWVLIFLISLLLGMGNRKKMWILGSAFIVVSAVVYFIFMAAWLNLILFLGFIVWVRIIIGLLALFGGSYSLKEFFTSKEGVCEVTNDNSKQKIIDRLKNITKQSNLWIALGGIVLLAFMVNLVELVCSAGLPAIFTQVLSMNGYSTLGYYSYILLYIFFFMLDDLIIFIIAMMTLKITGMTTRYSKYSHLIGGILMVIVGILLIFKPELLMFG